MIDFNIKNAQPWEILGEGMTIGKTVELIADRDEKFSLFCADMAVRIGINEFIHKHPEQFYEVGIAEQNMIGMAAAMAHEGFHVCAVAYAPFVTARVLDQIRVNLGYMKAPVVLIGLGAGLGAGDLGATHTSLEDISNMRTIPDMTVICPANCSELAQAIYQALKRNMPTYIRVTNSMKTNAIANFGFTIGEAIQLKKGKDIALISTGSLVNEVLEAAKKLEVRGIACSVYNMHTIKPLDNRILNEICLRYKVLYTVEEHNVIGGLGSAVAEYIADKENRPILRCIGIEDEYYYADLPDRLREKAGLTAEQLAESILQYKI